jgi:RecJ-like exonuclease
MRAFCDGCGRLRTVCLTVNPRGSIMRFSENGEKSVPVQECFCEDCAEIKMRRMLEWGLNG